MSKKSFKQDKNAEMLLKKLDEVVWQYAMATNRLEEGTTLKKLSAATQDQVENARLAGLAIVFYVTQRQLNEVGPSARVIETADMPYSTD